jgi:hypothetical protein
MPAEIGTVLEARQHPLCLVQHRLVVGIGPKEAEELVEADERARTPKRPPIEDAE